MVRQNYIIQCYLFQSKVNANLKRNEALGLKKIECLKPLKALVKPAKSRQPANSKNLFDAGNESGPLNLEIDPEVAASYEPMQIPTTKPSGNFSHLKTVFFFEERNNVGRGWVVGGLKSAGLLTSA